MVKTRDLAVSALVLTARASAFRCPQPGRHFGVIRNHASICSRCRVNNVERRSSCRRARASTAVAMVSEREEELKAKIAKLRGAASKGDSYERVVGKGSELTKKMENSKDEFEGSVAKAEQVCVFRLDQQPRPGA